MRPGDQCLFYHSNCKQPGCVALVRVCSDVYVDHTAFDRKDPHYDPKSDPKAPKWKMVDVKYERHLKRFISLQELKQNFNTPGNPLASVALFRLARLSVSPLTQAEFDFIMSLENSASPAAATGAPSPPATATAAHAASSSAGSAKRRKTSK